MLSSACRRFRITSHISSETEAHRAACRLQVSPAHCPPSVAPFFELTIRIAFVISTPRIQVMCITFYCRSYRCIVAGTRFPCPFDSPLVCGILDHWIAELQPHSNKRDPILSRHYTMNGKSPWQRSLTELLPANSLPQKLEQFCDLEHTHDSVMFNSVRATFKDMCEHMLAKLRPVAVSSDRQQELAAWMQEGLKEFAPRSDLARVGSCASGLDTSDSDLNMLMQPHDPQASGPSMHTLFPHLVLHGFILHFILACSHSARSYLIGRMGSTSSTTSASISKSARNPRTFQL